MKQSDVLLSYETYDLLSCYVGLNTLFIENFIVIFDDFYFDYFSE